MQKLQKMYEKICNTAKVRKTLNKAFHERYLELKSITNMPTSLAFELANLNRPLFYETSLFILGS